MVLRIFVNGPLFWLRRWFLSHFSNLDNFTYIESQKKAQDQAIMHYLVILIDNRMKFDHFDPFWLLKCDEKNSDNFFSSHFLLDLRLLPSLLIVYIFFCAFWPVDRHLPLTRESAAAARVHPIFQPGEQQPVSFAMKCWFQDLCDSDSTHTHSQENNLPVKGH